MLYGCEIHLLDVAAPQHLYSYIVSFGHIVVVGQGHMVAGSKQCPLLLQSVLYDSLTNLHSSFGFGMLTTHTTSAADPIRPYVCHTCGKRFKLNHHLKQHSRIHTGERPFACNLCGKTFTQQSSYHYHIKKKLCGSINVKTDITPLIMNQSLVTLASGIPSNASLQTGIDTGIGMSSGIQSDMAKPNVSLGNMSGHPMANPSGIHSNVVMSSGVQPDLLEVNVSMPNVIEPNVAHVTTDSNMDMLNPEVFEPNVT